MWTALSTEACNMAYTYQSYEDVNVLSVVNPRALFSWMTPARPKWSNIYQALGGNSNMKMPIPRPPGTTTGISNICKGVVTMYSGITSQ